jgi:DNA recombination-dependent growth factor C
VLSCVLDDTGVLRKLKFIGMDEDGDAVEEDPLGNMDAEFVVLTGTVRNLIDDLKKMLGGFAQAQAI